MTPRIRAQMENSGGRRFILAMGAGITTTFLQWNEKLDAAGNTYMMTVLGTVGAYIAANTIQKRNESTTTKMDSSGGRNDGEQ
jgi:hypothetical protein